ncbi:membrane protein insertion efficiency factor YidD [Luteimicrobium subarcticum]|uniref:Putative membrane protein insertion efficiency factor n=1 Tax=Luteimicrobium subarcticum TaxID=620910 RepID=A0A2M8WJG2_9MICO|nr:membrane protein insertion efficiency factor YidD [Luteimicrobium subarcticum]PJI91071.1 hypothetical protein CLV34_2335 [Luteimicrobium subarcticum]
MSRSAISRGFTFPIRLYQRWVSPLRPATCKYYPTCSAYAVASVEEHGPIKGFVLAAWRLLRCNPWSRGGVDDVPPRGTWRSPTLHQHDPSEHDRLPAA